MTINDFVRKTNLKKDEAKILIKFVTNLTETDLILHPETQLTKDQESKLIDCEKRRLEGLPIAYIINSRSFYRDTFYVCEGVLIPQPDTEIIVEEAIKTAKSINKKNIKILDLCSGSGCIGISVAKELAASIDDLEIDFTDLSSIAVECTKHNAENLLKGIKYNVYQGNLFESLKDKKYDLILTNPPYIPTSVIENLESDVRHEPLLALDGGTEGLDIIKQIIEQSERHLNNDSYLLIEIGYDQGSQVEQLFKDHNFINTCVIKDLGMRNRVVKGRH